MRTATTIAAAVIPVMLLAGCTSPGGPMSTPSASGSRPPFPTMSPVGTPSGTPTQVTPAQLQAITADLVARGVTAPPTVTSAMAVTWNDSSLGCPKPGMMYSQVITPGFRVLVEADGKPYDYRFGRGDTPTLCSSGH